MAASIRSSFEFAFRLKLWSSKVHWHMHVIVWYILPIVSYDEWAAQLTGLISVKHPKILVNNSYFPSFRFEWKCFNKSVLQLLFLVLWMTAQPFIYIYIYFLPNCKETHFSLICLGRMWKVNNMLFFTLTVSGNNCVIYL